MEEKEGNMDKSHSVSVFTLSADPMNMSSTLKLTDNDVMQKNAKNTALSKSEPELYDAFGARDKKNATKDSGALLHLLKSSLGSGILAMPGAFKHGGLAFGIIGTIIVGIICTHCVHLLVKCSQKLSIRVKKPSLSFAETAEEAFKNGPEKYKGWAAFAREFVLCALLATYYFGNTVYVVFVAASFKQVFDDLGYYLAIRLWILIIGIPLLPLGIIRTLKYLVPFSAIATVFILFGLSTTLYFTFQNLKTLSEVSYIAPPTEWPVFFSTVLFAMEGIGTVLPIENSMKNPEHFLGCPGVLNIAMSTVVILYAIVGFFGYLRFGDETKASITLNLGETWLAQTVKISVALSILFTYGLQFTVPSDIIFTKIKHKFAKEKHDTVYYVMRAAMIIGTVIVAIIVPELSPFISLVGAVCFSILGLFCPSIIDIMTRYDEGFGFMKWHLWKNIFIVILSVFSLVSGSYVSLIEIIASYKK